MGIFYAPLGGQMLIYPYYVSADYMWDRDGHKVDIDLDAEGLLFRPAYHIRLNEKTTLYLNGVVPLGRVSIKNPVTGRRETSTGIGDVVLVPSIWYTFSKEKNSACSWIACLPLPLETIKKKDL